MRKKIEGKGKQIEQRSKLDKEVVQLKFKGNQKQFELNAELDAIFESIAPNLSQIKKLSQEGRQRTWKWQKLIKIADKSRDSLQAVAEYKSDEFVSSSKMRSNLRRQEKKWAARDVKRNNSLVIVERKQGLLWVLIISFFVVRKRALSWLLGLLLPNHSKVSVLGHRQKWDALNVMRRGREVGW